jgi:hypothetical protein
MLWICRGCRAYYAVGAAACPQCGQNDHVDQGEEHLLDVALPIKLDDPADQALGDVGEQGPEPAVAVSVDGVDQGAGELGELPPGRPFEQLPEAVEGTSAEQVVRPDYDAWDVAELRTEAKSRGLPSSGGREVLVARLSEHDETPRGERD